MQIVILHRQTYQLYRAKGWRCPNYTRVILVSTDTQHGVELGKGERETFPDDYEAVACILLDMLGTIRTT